MPNRASHQAAKIPKHMLAIKKRRPPRPTGDGTPVWCVEFDAQQQQPKDAKIASQDDLVGIYPSLDQQSTRKAKPSYIMARMVDAMVIHQSPLTSSRKLPIPLKSLFWFHPYWASNVDPLSSSGLEHCCCRPRPFAFGDE
jgi:hypothetical protein